MEKVDYECRSNYCVHMMLRVLWVHCEGMSLKCMITTALYVGFTRGMYQQFYQQMCIVT